MIYAAHQSQRFRWTQNLSVFRSTKGAFGYRNISYSYPKEPSGSSEISSLSFIGRNDRLQQNIIHEHGFWGTDPLNFLFTLGSDGDKRWLVGMVLALRIRYWDWDGYCTLSEFRKCAHEILERYKFDTKWSCRHALANKL